MATTPAGLYGPATRVPAIPDTRTSKPEDVAKAMKEWIEVREGVRGDGMDKAVTVRDLLNSGLATPFDLRHIGNPGLGQIPGGTGADPDIPPTPTNLEASGAFKYIIVTWDFARGYSRLAYFELWRGLTDVLGDAILVAQPFGAIYADDVGPGKTYYYWVRAVSDAPAFSPYSSLSGVKGETALDPAYLIGLLQGQIGESALNQALGTRINLIDATSEVAGSVAARIKAETDARVNAIQSEIDSRNAALNKEILDRTTHVQAETDARVDAVNKEISDRIAALLAEKGARETYVINYTYSKQDVDSALAIYATQLAATYTYTDQKTGAAIITAAADVRDYTYAKSDIDAAEAAQTVTLTANYTAYADAARTAAIATASADVRNYTYAKSDITGAIAAAETRLRSEFVNAGGATEAFVTNYTYSKAQSDSAEAAQTNTLTVAYKQYADGKSSDAVTIAAADVRNYTFARADITAALAVQSTDLTTAYTAYADAARASAVSTAAADVRTYAVSKTDAASAEASQTQALTAAYKTYADGVGGAVATAAAADVRNYAYSKTDVNQSEATQTANITTAFQNYANGVGNAAAADVRQYAYSKSDTTSAIAATAADLRSEFSTNNGATQAYVQQYTYSKTQSDAAEAGQNSTLTTAFQTYADAKRDEATTASSADVRNYAYSKATVDGGFATQFSTLTANYTAYTNGALNSAVTVASADVRNYAYSQAQTNSAIASATQTLQTTLNGYTGAIQTNATAIDGLKLQYTLKLDNNGYISGFGLASDPVNGVPYSMMIVRSDSFSIGSPAGPGIPPSIPFIVRTTVTTINGVTVPIGTYIADAFIANGSISNAKIGNLQVDDAKIANVSVAKLRAGAISVSEYIESSNFASGQAGWRIHGNGDPEFRNGIFRGTVYATAGKIANVNIAPFGMYTDNFVNAVSGWFMTNDGGVQFNNIYARGSLSGGAFSAWAWPASGGGFYLGAEGLMLGNPNNGGGFVMAGSNGEMHMPGFDYVGQQLTLTNTVLIAPRFGANASALMSPAAAGFSISPNVQYTGMFAGTWTANAVSMGSNLSYKWSVNNTANFVSNAYFTTNPGSNQAQLWVTTKTPAGYEGDVYIYCEITNNDNGLTRTCQGVATISA